MYCPSCLCEKTKVNKTIKTLNTNERYRVCEECNFTFLTIEAIKTDRYWEEYRDYTLESNSKVKTVKEHEKQTYISFGEKDE